MAKTLGYARVSSDSQDVATQKAKLEKLGAVVVFTETGNGSSLDGRDQLEAAIRLLDRGDERGVPLPRLSCPRYRRPADRGREPMTSRTCEASRAQRWQLLRLREGSTIALSR